MPTVDISLGNRSYPVIIGSGLLGRADTWSKFLTAGKILVVSNELVAPLYIAQVLNALPDGRVQSLILPDGESSKTVSSWSLIIDKLIEMEAGRDACVLALGGGVTGDLSGFAAAAYMRGIHYIQAPTTLLAQVDASVGGKTAVNHPAGKNLVGAFYQPRAVIADTDTLDTLPAREYGAGLAEAVKYGIIRDPEFFDWIELRADKIRKRDKDSLNTMIVNSVRNKARVVAEDELEAGCRALLNFGHTFAHALETVSGYTRFLHGEAVSIGMVVAARLSENRGLCPEGVTMRISGLLEALELPVHIPSDINSDSIVEAMALDKKSLGGKIRLILLTSLGCAVIDSDSTEQEIRAAIDESR